MVDILQKESSSVDLNELVIKFQTEVIGKEIERATQGESVLLALLFACSLTGRFVVRRSGVYPLQNVFIRKVKLLKSPKLDVGKLLDNHGGADAVAAADQGQKVCTRSSLLAIGVISVCSLCCLPRVCLQVERPEEGKDAKGKKGKKGKKAAAADDDEDE